MWNESMVFSLWAGVAVKSALVMGLAWLISLLLKRRSAAARHLLWTAAFMTVLAMPVFSVFVPAVRIPSVEAMVPASFFETSTATDISHSQPAQQGSSGLASTPLATSRRLDWSLLLLAIWGAGVGLALAQMGIAYIAMMRIRRTAVPNTDPQLARRLASQLGISHSVDVLETRAGSMPMTWGIVRPAIFLPSEAARWTEERLGMVLLHELAHVRRADVATHLAGRLALVLNWWNPLAWMAWREFLKERERAADDLVLHSGARASEYAGHLLEVARSMQSQNAVAWGAVAMARRSQLEGRLVAILDSKVNRNGHGRVSVLAAALLAVGISVPIAALHAQEPAGQPALADIDATIRAAKAQKNYEMLLKPAEAFQALREYPNARKLLDAALAISAANGGDQGGVLLKLAELESRRGRQKEAEELYARAVQLTGDRPEAALALIYQGVIHISSKNYDQAAAYFQKAQNLDAKQTGPAQMWMAVLREREQNFPEAEALYRNALAVEDPGSDDAATNMELYSSFLKERGREAEAQSMSERASLVRKALAEQQRQPKSTAPRIEGGMTPPKVLQRVEPEYTELARTAKYQGTVVLAVEVDSTGVARNIRVAKGLGLGLSENAVAAIRQWQFQPAIKDGAPVTVQATIEVNFRLL
jgi:TonB family protein